VTCANCGVEIKEWRSTRRNTRFFCSRKCHGAKKSAEHGSVADRFWAKVQKGDGCWLWTAHKSPKGYGEFTPGPHTRVPMRAPRFAWELQNGPIPVEMCVLHKCDVPACVNPDHLFLGTILDNNRDRNAKGRANMPFGDKHWNTKITEPQLSEVKHWHAEGRSQSEIARLFGVSRGAIRRILDGRRRQLPQGV
jgi:hypothetical protein